MVRRSCLKNYSRTEGAESLPILRARLCAGGVGRVAVNAGVPALGDV
jgi:hypothetical protein